jgi:hypothetical protein
MGLEPYRGDYYLWYYVPSLGAAAVFLVLFGVLTIIHLYRLFKTRTWFCIPFAIGGICTFDSMGLIKLCRKLTA